MAGKIKGLLFFDSTGKQSQTSCVRDQNWLEMLSRPTSFLLSLGRWSCPSPPKIFYVKVPEINQPPESYIGTIGVCHTLMFQQNFKRKRTLSFRIARIETGVQENTRMEPHGPLCDMPHVRFRAASLSRYKHGMPVCSKLAMTFGLEKWRNGPWGTSQGYQSAVLWLRPFQHMLFCTANLFISSHHFIMMDMLLSLSIVILLANGWHHLNAIVNF